MKNLVRGHHTWRVLLLLICGTLVFIAIGFRSRWALLWKSASLSRKEDVIDRVWAAHRNEVSLAGLTRLLEAVGCHDLDCVSIQITKQQTKEDNHIEIVWEEVPTSRIRLGLWREPLLCRAILLTAEGSRGYTREMDPMRRWYSFYQPEDCMMKVVTRNDTILHKGPQKLGARNFNKMVKLAGWMFIPTLVTNGGIVHIKSRDEPEAEWRRRQARIISSTSSFLGVDDADLLIETPWILAHDADVVFTNKRVTVDELALRIWRGFKQRPVLFPELSAPALGSVDRYKYADLHWAMPVDFGSGGKKWGLNSGVILFRPSKTVMQLAFMIAVTFRDSLKSPFFHGRDQAWMNEWARSFFGIDAIKLDTILRPVTMGVTVWNGGPEEDQIMAAGVSTAVVAPASREAALAHYEAMQMWAENEPLLTNDTNAMLSLRGIIGSASPWKPGVIFAIVPAPWMDSFPRWRARRRQFNPSWGYWKPGDFILHQTNVYSKKLTQKFLRIYNSSPDSPLPKKRTLVSTDSEI